MLAIHLDGAFLTTKTCVPHMKAQGAGAVALYLAVFETNAVTGQSLTVSHGWHTG